MMSAGRPTQGGVIDSGTRDRVDFRRVDPIRAGALSVVSKDRGDPLLPRWYALSFLIFCSVAVSIGSASFSDYRHDSDAGPDMVRYVRMYEGAELRTVPPPYRYRVVVPFAARFVPAPPARLLAEPATAVDRGIAFRFAVLNVLGLTTAAGFLFALMAAMRFEPLESLLGGLLFLLSHVVLTHGALPLVDAWAWALWVGCLYALLTSRHLLLGLLFAIGLWTKETTLLVLPSALLLPRDRRARWMPLAWLGLPLAAYVMFRIGLSSGEPPLYSLDSTAAYIGRLAGETPRLLFVTGRVFGVVALFALVGWLVVRRDRDHPLARWAPLVPLVLLVPFLLALNVPRVWFFAFPIVIPLGVLGLRVAVRRRAGRFG
jgi:hypothetical protein